MSTQEDAHSMHFECADRNPADFALLCKEPDDYLDEVAGGRENRARFLSLNKTDKVRG